MPNLLTFTTPAQPPPIKYARIVEARNVNATAQTITVRVELFGDGGARERTEWTVVARNGTSTGIEVADPPEAGETFRSVSVETPNGFDQVLGAFFQGGETAMLATMAGLGLLPAGAAT